MRGCAPDRHTRSGSGRAACRDRRGCLRADHSESRINLLYTPDSPLRKLHVKKTSHMVCPGRPKK